MGKNQIKSGVILSYVILVVNTIGGLLITPFLLRALGQNSYGLYTLIASFSGYMMLMDFGTTTTTVRYIAKYRAENNQLKVEKFIGTILSFYTFIGIMIIMIGSIIYFNLGSIFASSVSASQLPMAKNMFALIIVNTALIMLMKALPAIITAYEKFTFSKLMELLRVIARLLCIYIFIKMGASALSIIVIDTILNLSLTISRLYYVIVKLNVKLKFGKLDINFIKEIGQYSFFIFLASIVNQVNVKVDQLILGMVATTAQVAVSGVSLKLNEYYHQIASALSGLFLPKITGMVTNNKSTEIEEYSIKVGKLQGKLLILILTGFIGVGRQFVGLWAGEGYGNVYYIVIILMVSNLPTYTHGILLSVTQAMNKHKVRNIIYFLTTIMNVVMTIPLAKSHGALGAAIATGFSMFISNILITIFYHKVIGIQMYRYTYETIVKALPSAIFALLAVFLSTMVLKDGYITFILKTLIIFIVYFGSLWFIDFTPFEKKIVKNILSKIGIKSVSVHD